MVVRLFRFARHLISFLIFIAALLVISLINVQVAIGLGVAAVVITFVLFLTRREANN